MLTQRREANSSCIKRGVFCEGVKSSLAALEINRGRISRYPTDMECLRRVGTCALFYDRFTDPCLFFMMTWP